MFRQLDSRVYASPQIAIEDVAEAARLGLRLIVNNRPEGESDDQTPGEVIERAALDRAGDDAGDGENRGVLAYCRSGTRSTLLWALAEAQAGKDPAKLAAAAAAAGYDLTPIRALLTTLASGAR